MTYAAFLQRLAETPRDWWFLGGEMIRRGESVGECPLRAAYSGEGLSVPLLQDIMNAADDTIGHVPSIRADLLRACGLATETE